MNLNEAVDVTPAAPPPAGHAVAIAKALAGGGVVLVAGSKASNFPSALREHPRLAFWDSDESFADKVPAIPSNTRHIICLRFVRHHTSGALRDYSRARSIGFDWLGTGEARKLLEEAIVELDQARAEHSAAVTPPDRPKRGMDWLREADGRGIIKWHERYVDIAPWLVLQAKRDGISLDEKVMANYLSQLGVERGHRRHASRDGVPASAPVPKPEPEPFTRADVELPLATPRPAPPTASSPAVSGDEEFGALQKYIADAVASLQLLSEFVEGLKQRTAKAREREARLRAVLDERE